MSHLFRACLNFPLVFWWIFRAPSAQYYALPLWQVFCIFLFLCAASLFGTIIAQVNEIVTHMTTKKKDLDERLEIYLSVNPRRALVRLASSRTDPWIPFRSLNSRLLMSMRLAVRRLNSRTMFEIRTWERFQFSIDTQHEKVATAPV
jgi:hypothetical protein